MHLDHIEHILPITSFEDMEAVSLQEMYERAIQSVIVSGNKNGWIVVLSRWCHQRPPRTGGQFAGILTVFIPLGPHSFASEEGQG
jgi:hypothetical protein